jgi:4-amino-4-deoxy-L-arabinose transferase-like glycosyltransferase
MPSPPRAWSDVLAATLLVTIVATFYLARLADQPLVGEETRWANGAREMLATGDWIVPRQQGQVFPERPPMTMWLIAIAGYFRGGVVDAVAIRLPSVLAVVLTTLVVYAYARTLISGFAAFVAAIAYASMAQVLQIGRMGESEAVFTLLVSSSLLLWHLGYLRGWPPLATWSVGFACAALGALTKGPQAPVYFVAITAVYLFLRGDWRYLVSWQYAAGATVLAAIIAAWQIPFYLATDFDAVLATWAGLAADRFHLSGLLRHLLEYPLETFASLLPWSPILVAYAKREMRDVVADQRDVTSFAVVALAVAYPTVWFVAGAQARYFMPLYPIIAVLVGLAIDRCSVATVGCYPRRAWHQFLLLASTLMTALCFAVWYPASWSLAGFQPQWFAVALLVFAATAIGVLAFTYRSGLRNGIANRRLPAVIVIATFAGLTLGGVLMNRNLARWNDPASAVAAMREFMTHSQPLVSLTPIDHRFAYYYGKPIAELEWPIYVGDLPLDVDYFCFMRRPGDTAESREAGRGRSWTTSPGTLPFAWEEVATLCVERLLRDYPQRVLVLGRVVKPRLAHTNDATQPQANAVNLTAATPSKTRDR